MTTTDQPDLTNAAPALVPESLPFKPPCEAVTPRRIGLVLGLPVSLVVPFLPRTLGPHLAASRWYAAYAAHLFCLLIGIGALYSNIQDIVIVDPAPRYTAIEQVQRPFAAITYMGMQMRRWSDWIPVLTVFGAIQLLVWFGGFSLMPMITFGEPFWRCYRRAVKLMLWSTGWFVAVAYALPYGLDWVIGSRGRYDEEAVGFLVMWVLATWWVMLLVRLGSRLPGPGAGSAWEPRAVSCEGCGYDLAMLPTDGRCPECGLAIKASLHSIRRPPAFAAARWYMRPSGWVRTTFASLRSVPFAKTLPVWSGHGAARAYVIGHAVFVAAVAYAVAVVVLSPEHSRSSIPPSAVLAGLLAAVATFVLYFHVVMLMAFVFGVPAMGRRTIAVCYSCVWFTLACLLTGSVMLGWALNERYDLYPWPRGSFVLPLLGRVDWMTVLGVLAFAPAGCVLGIWLFQIRHMLRATRHANA